MKLVERADGYWKYINGGNCVINLIPKLTSLFVHHNLLAFSH
jgi:hypothetical protein